MRTIIQSGIVLVYSSLRFVPQSFHPNHFLHRANAHSARRHHEFRATPSFSATAKSFGVLAVRSVAVSISSYSCECPVRHGLKTNVLFDLIQFKPKIATQHAHNASISNAADFQCRGERVQRDAPSPLCPVSPQADRFKPLDTGNAG